MISTLWTLGHILPSNGSYYHRNIPASTVRFNYIIHQHKPCYPMNNSPAQTNNFLKPCECGKCNELILPYDKRGRPRRFVNNHHFKVMKHIPRYGPDHNRWKGGKWI